MIKKLYSINILLYIYLSAGVTWRTWGDSGETSGNSGETGGDLVRWRPLGDLERPCSGDPGETSGDSKESWGYTGP